MLLLTILKSTDSEHEQLIIYKLLEEAVTCIPNIFPITFNFLTNKFDQLLSSSQNNELLQSVLNISQSICDQHLEGASVTSVAIEDYLISLRFSGIPTSDRFNNPQPYISLLSSLLDSILLVDY